MGYQRINFVFVGDSQTRASIVQKCLASIDKASSDRAIGLGTSAVFREDSREP
jgi:hypothetical protein